MLTDLRKQEDLQVHAELAPRYASRPRATSVYMDFWWRVLTRHADLTGVTSVLDFCCGDSAMLSRLTGLGLCVGVDISDTMLGLARTARGAAKLVRGDGERLPFGDECFDVVLSIGALHHLPVPSAGARQIARVLRRGGRLLVSEPCADSLVLRGPRKLLRHLRGFSRAHTAFRAAELESMLAEQGLEVESREYFGHAGFLLCALDHQVGLVRRVPRRLQLLAGRALTWVDSVLMRVPGIGPQAFHVVMSARRPELRPPVEPAARGAPARSHDDRRS